MPLVLALVFLSGLVPPADRPQLFVRADGSPCAAVGDNVPRPAQPTRPPRDRPRAHVERREDGASRTRCAAVIEAAPAPAVARGLAHASPRLADPFPEPLFRTFCALLC